MLSPHATQLVSYLFLSTLSLSSYALTLSEGHYDRYTFPVEAQKSYELTFTQSNCQVNDGINTCCALLLNHGNSQPQIDAYHYLIASKQAAPSMLIDSDVDGTINVAIYATNPNIQCIYEAPEIKASALTSSTITSGDGINQLGVNYTSVDGSRIDTSDNRYYLRDISRRANLNTNPGYNGGAMNSIAEITTSRITGYEPRSGALLYDFSPASNNQWKTGYGKNDEADAQVNTIKTYDYWLNTLGLNSYDNKGSSMYAYVDLPYPLEESTFCGTSVPAGSLYNAFSLNSSIYFTPSNTTDLFTGQFHSVSLSAALDVTAHEWAHSITNNTAQLNYQRESGALNEAFSDWMGIAVEHASGQHNWTMGESSETLRDISNPKAFGDPDTYMGEYWEDVSLEGCPTPDVCNNDFCGVHSNSGVANKMFYLLASGGMHNGEEVIGLGINTAMQIATDAMRFQWTENENFSSARTGMEAAAENYGTHAIIQVGNAWRAVGVKSNAEIEAERIAEENRLAAEKSSNNSSGGGGGGGCSLNRSSSPLDPTLWLLVFASIIYLHRKRFVASLKKCNHD